MSELSGRAMSILYTILGIVITILVLVALLPTVDSAFTDLTANVSASENFAGFSDLLNILPLMFIVGVFVLIIGLIMKRKH